MHLREDKAQEVVIIEGEFYFQEIKGVQRAVVEYKRFEQTF